MVASEWEKYRKIVDYGIEALKAIWHETVDADGKSGMELEFIRNCSIFKEKFLQQDTVIMMQTEYALVWFFFQELIILNKKNVERL